MSPKMRLPLLPPASLNPDQKDLYDDMVGLIDNNFGDLIARRDDGALIGPFNGWLHFRSSAGPRGPSTNPCGYTPSCPPQSTSW